MPDDKYTIELTEPELYFLKTVLASATLKAMVQLPATPKNVRNLFKSIKEKLDKPEKQRIITLQ